MNIKNLCNHHLENDIKFNPCNDNQSGSIIKGILAAPPKATPTRNKGLIRPY